MPGHFALVLRAHLPFVRLPEHEHFLGEEWFFEAITETYVPLLRMMERLVDDLCPVSGAGLSRRSMQNCLGTGGSKNQFSWKHSFATQYPTEISSLRRRVNIWPRI